MNPPARSVTTLVVEDSVPVRERLCALLMAEGCVQIVAEAGSVREGFLAFERFRPQAVILDIGLPDGTGLDLLRQIKKAAPLCFAIVLTGFREPVFAELARTLGADCFFHKATEFERVTETLRALALEPPMTP